MNLNKLLILSSSALVFVCLDVSDSSASWRKQSARAAKLSLQQVIDRKGLSLARQSAKEKSSLQKVIAGKGVNRTANSEVGKSAVKKPLLDSHEWNYSRRSR